MSDDGSVASSDREDDDSIEVKSHTCHRIRIPANIYGYIDFSDLSPELKKKINDYYLFIVAKGSKPKKEDKQKELACYCYYMTLLQEPDSSSPTRTGSLFGYTEEAVREIVSRMAKKDNSFEILLAHPRQFVREFMDIAGLSSMEYDTVVEHINRIMEKDEGSLSDMAPQGVAQGFVYYYLVNIRVPPLDMSKADYADRVGVSVMTLNKTIKLFTFKKK